MSEPTGPDNEFRSRFEEVAGAFMERQVEIEGLLDRMESTIERLVAAEAQRAHNTARLERLADRYSFTRWEAELGD